MAGKPKNEKREKSQPRKRGIPLSVIYADSFYGLNSFSLFNCFSPTSQVLLSSVSFIICFFYHLFLLSSVSFIICFFFSFVSISYFSLYMFHLSSLLDNSLLICFSLFHLFIVSHLVLSVLLKVFPSLRVSLYCLNCFSLNNFLISVLETFGLGQMTSLL